MRKIFVVCQFYRFLLINRLRLVLNWERLGCLWKGNSKERLKSIFGTELPFSNWKKKKTGQQLVNVKILFLKISAEASPQRDHCPKHSRQFQKKRKIHSDPVGTMYKEKILRPCGTLPMLAMHSISAKYERAVFENPPLGIFSSFQILVGFPVKAIVYVSMRAIVSVYERGKSQLWTLLHIIYITGFSSFIAIGLFPLVIRTELS